MARQSVAERHTCERVSSVTPTLTFSKLSLDMPLGEGVGEKKREKLKGKEHERAKGKREEERGKEDRDNE